MYKENENKEQNTKKVKQETSAAQTNFLCGEC